MKTSLRSEKELERAWYKQEALGVLLDYSIEFPLRLEIASYIFLKKVIREVAIYSV